MQIGLFKQARRSAGDPPAHMVYGARAKKINVEIVERKSLREALRPTRKQGNIAAGEILKNIIKHHRSYRIINTLLAGSYRKPEAEEK